MFTDPNFEPLYHLNDENACGGIAFYYRTSCWPMQPGSYLNRNDARLLDGEPPPGNSIVVCGTCHKTMPKPPSRKET